MTEGTLDFGSQTSNNMDRWKSRGGTSQRREEKRSEVKRREEKRREEKRRRKKIREEKESEERVRGKKMQAREKVEKSRNNMCFQWFVSPEGRKVGSLKRRVRSHQAG